MGMQTNSFQNDISRSLSAFLHLRYISNWLFTWPQLVVGGTTALMVLPCGHSSPRREVPFLALHLRVSKWKRPMSQMLDKILSSGPSHTHSLPEIHPTLIQDSPPFQANHLCSAESNPYVPDSMLISLTKRC